jgi:hypothetical protein
MCFMTKTTDIKNESRSPSFSDELADLILTSDGDTTWLEQKDVRHAWHLVFFGAAGISITFILGRLLFSGLMGKSALYTEIFRAYRFFGMLILIALTINLGFQFYKHLLITGRDLRFKSVTLFMTATILLFGGLYYSLYFWRPELFLYYSPAIIPAVTATDLTVGNILALLEFLLYSACTSISVSYPKISSNSSIVSIINFLQVGIWITLMGLFIATFVQLAAIRKK